MKKLYYFLIGFALFTVPLFGQDYLTPAAGFKSETVFPADTTFGPFDIIDSLIYASDGDAIRCMNLNTGLEIRSYEKPAGYLSYASFITMSPNGKEIWAGYTVFDGSDDRIYTIDVEKGVWDLKAKMPFNFDLVFWNDSILISGMNSSSWLDPASIFVLDTTGWDNHRKIVEVGGYSAGLALDEEGDLYYGTSLATDLNALYKWDSTDIARILGAVGADTLVPGDARKLSDLPSGAYDCEIDGAGNLVFNLNNFAGDKVVALWNGVEGDGFNFDTLSVATGDSDWLGMIKTQGNLKLPEIGNRVFTISIGTPLLEVHMDYIPFVDVPISDLWFFTNNVDSLINVSRVFTDPDDPDSSIVISVVSNSNTALLDANVIRDELVLSNIGRAIGEAEIILEGNSGGAAVTDTFLVTIDSGLGLIDSKSLNMELFPNPNNGTFTVRTNSFDRVTLTIHMMNGTVVYENPYYLSGSQIDMSIQPAGSYVIRIVNSNREVSRIIQKH